MPKTNSFISWIGMTGESFGNRKGTPEFRTPHTHHHGERATRPKNSPTEGLISVVQNPTSHNIDLPRKTQREHDRLLLGNIRAPLKKKPLHLNSLFPQQFITFRIQSAGRVSSWVSLEQAWSWTNLFSLESSMVIVRALLGKPV